MKKPSLKEHLSILFEEPSSVPINPSDPKPTPLEIQNLSLDMKVDNYFMTYEKQSLPTSQTYAVPGTDLGMQMEQGFSKLFRGLLEADEDPTAPPAGDDPTAAPPGMDAGAPPPAGGPVPGTPPAVENPRFDASNFAQSVARLVMNFDSLVDPKTIILNRARAYIEKNYDAGIAKQMMDILASQFQMVPREDTEGSGPVAPPAAGAWSGVAGGGG